MESEDEAISGIVLEHNIVGKIVILSIIGSPSAVGRKELEQQLDGFFNRDYRWFIIDLTKARMLQSAMIGVILGMAKKVLTDGGLCIVSPSERIQYVLDITRVSGIIPTYDSVDDAIESFKESSG